MIVVVDASAIGALLLPDEAGAMTDRVRAAFRDHAVHVPPVWPVEIASLLLNAHRRRRIDDDQRDRASRSAQRLAAVVTIEPDPTIEATVAMGLATGLSACDAAYALVAERLRAPLLTGNPRLARAAEARGIEIFA